MILAYEQVVTEYLFFSEGANGAGKTEFHLSLPIYNLISM